MIIEANLIDIHLREIYPARLKVKKGVISSIEKIREKQERYILPGLIDAHVHIESSMVSPLAFSKKALTHGTLAVVTDPHEIANVLGVEGVNYMVENSRLSSMKFMFGAPSCVPATDFETSGSRIDVSQIKELIKLPEIGFLSEMMNYPGVIHDNPEVIAKLDLARKFELPVDGHAPNLSGDDLEKYASKGISTDHECSSIEEAEEKIEKGMSILIREGSAAKNFSALIPLLKSHPEKIMFCTDDIHPDDLMDGHIDRIVKRAMQLGYDVFDVLRAATLNPVKHYKLNVGLLRENDPADFILIDSVKDFNILQNVIDGNIVFDKETNATDEGVIDTPNRFRTKEISQSSIELSPQKGRLKVIQAMDGELLTNKIYANPVYRESKLVSNPDEDILKVIVLNRYSESFPAVGFINGFGIKKGALASSIAHDSHNIICVGVEDEHIQETVNWIIAKKGGIAVHDGKSVSGLDLPIAGIMSDKSVEYVGMKYEELSKKAKLLGSILNSPFMTLAFMSLLVIPKLKLSDKGLFDCETFSFTSLFDE